MRVRTAGTPSWTICGSDLVPPATPAASEGCGLASVFWPTAQRQLMRLANRTAEVGASLATGGMTERVGNELPAGRLRRVTQYIKANLPGELRLAELSALVHMSPYHFSRLFKRSTGMPPHRFLLRRRIAEAQVLLTARTVPIAEIARLVGFRTPSHFTMTFRRITGMTPRAYRTRPGAA